LQPQFGKIGISRFSLDALVNMAARLGRVQVKIKAA